MVVFCCFWWISRQRRVKMLIILNQKSVSIFHGGLIEHSPWSVSVEENPSTALKYDQWCCFEKEFLFQARTLWAEYLILISSSPCVPPSKWLPFIGSREDSDRSLALQPGSPLSPRPWDMPVWPEQVVEARLQGLFLSPPQGVEVGGSQWALCQETCPGNAKRCNSQTGYGQSTAGQTTASRTWQVVRVFFCSGVQGWVSVMSVNYSWSSGDLSGTSINVHPEMLS